MLRQIGPRLSSLLRDEDTLARLGGDEFAVVLMPGDETTASAAGLRLRSALEQSFEVGGIRVHIDASVGIAIFPDHSRDALGLLQRADVAMYEAKRMRTGHEVYLPARDRHSRERLALVGELHGALEAGELVLHYQPKADVRTGAVRGVEALVRWQHPQRGLLGPGPLPAAGGAERADPRADGASSSTARWRRSAISAAPGSTSASRSTSGPPTCSTSACPSEIERILALHGFDPANLRLEVSEDAVMADLERTVEVLTGLRQIGVPIALDDFGAGRVLARPPARAADRRAQDRPLVRDAARRGRARRRDRPLDRRPRPPARAQRRRGGRREPRRRGRALAEWGCDEVQGHLLGRPMTAAELDPWLRAVAGRPARTSGPPVWPAA